MSSLKEFWCGFVLAVGICVLALALILVDDAKGKIEQAVQSGVLVWHGQAYVVEPLGGRE